MAESECPGCGLVLPETGGPTHAYVPTSPECWRLFAETAHQVRHRLLSDAYMAQHPDGDDRRQLQSVAVHLITVQAILVEGQPLSEASRITTGAIELGRTEGGFPKLDRPRTWRSTIQDVASRAVAAEQFIEDVHSAWEPTEGTRIEEWTRRTLTSLYQE